jgi:hypothetical protein
MIARSHSTSIATRINALLGKIAMILDMLGAQPRAIGCT